MGTQQCWKVLWKFPSGFTFLCKEDNVIMSDPPFTVPGLHHSLSSLTASHSLWKTYGMGWVLLLQTSQQFLEPASGTLLFLQWEACPGFHWRSLFHESISCLHHPGFSCFKNLTCPIILSLLGITSFFIFKYLSHQRDVLLISAVLKKKNLPSKPSFLMSLQLLAHSSVLLCP